MQKEIQLKNDVISNFVDKPLKIKAKNEIIKNFIHQMLPYVKNPFSFNDDNFEEEADIKSQFSSLKVPRLVASKSSDLAKQSIESISTFLKWDKEFNILSKRF